MMRSSSSSTSGPKEHGPAYANAHIPDFLALPFTVLPNGPSDNVADSPVQVIHCGANVTAEAFRQGRLSIQQPLLIRDTPESIGMRVPPPNFTIRDVAERVGAEYPLHVLDVELQTELEGWTLGDMWNTLKTRNVDGGTKERLTKLLHLRVDDPGGLRPRP